MLRARLPPLNPDNDGRCLEIFDAELAEEVLNKEGKYPYRGPGLIIFELMRKRRPGKSKQNTTVL